MLDFLIVVFVAVVTAIVLVGGGAMILGVIKEILRDFRRR